MASSVAYKSVEAETEVEVARPPERITVRAFVLGLITIAGMCVFAENYGRGLVRTFMPVTALLALMLWSGINILLRLIVPRLALSRTEVMTIFGLTWLIGTIPGIGMVGYMFLDITGPAYFSSPEDRFWEVAGPYIPDFLYLRPGSRAAEQYMLGLRPGETVAWGAWLRPLFWWFSGTAGLVFAGFFASVLFYRQWAERERLNFPLATFPLDLMRDSGRSPVPDAFKRPVFWLGFACTAAVIGWNIVGYFILTLPEITLYYHPMFKNIDLGPYFPPFNVRVHPLFMGLAYHCPLNILFSFWVFYILNILKEGMMNRTGFVLGLEGQPATPRDALALEAHGAMVFLVVWSLWVARHHLKETLRKAFSGPRSNDDGLPVSYRTAWIGFFLCTIFLMGWFRSVGFGLPATLLQLTMLFIAYFAVSKYAAATGFVFLVPPGRKGWLIMKSIVGTASFSPPDLTGIQVVHGSGFNGGTSRMVAIPAISHFFRLIGDALRRHPLVVGALPAALVTGYVVQCWVHLDFNHTEGGMNVGWIGFSGRLRSLVTDIEATNPSVFDSQKLLAWIIGAAEGGLLMFLGSRFTSWPIHPVGLAFPHRFGFSMLLLWLFKTIVLRLGGVSLYERSKPFWYGVIIGYLVGLAVSTIVDIVWFPTVRGYGTMHGVHSK